MIDLLATKHGQRKFLLWTSLTPDKMDPQLHHSTFCSLGEFAFTIVLQSHHWVGL
jgi:hypothetical protein